MNVKKVYFWRELTEDGLLRELKTSEDVNGYRGFFESREKAIEALSKSELASNCKDYVLVTSYRTYF